MKRRPEPVEQILGEHAERPVENDSRFVEVVVNGPKSWSGFLAYTGVRFGEFAALRVRRLDLARRRAMITQSVTVVQGQGLVWGTPKSHERREVPIPRFLVEDLAAHVAGKDPEELVFSGVRRGGVLRVAVFRYGAFDAAAAAIGEPGLHPHELRHTAASLAIASGADVKVVQQMLGRSSATMTMTPTVTCSRTVSTRSPRPWTRRDRQPARRPGRPSIQRSKPTLLLPPPVPVLPPCCPGQI